MHKLTRRLLDNKDDGLAVLTLDVEDFEISLFSPIFIFFPVYSTANIIVFVWPQFTVPAESIPLLGVSHKTSVM